MGFFISTIRNLLLVGVQNVPIVQVVLIVSDLVWFKMFKLFKSFETVRDRNFMLGGRLGLRARGSFLGLYQPPVRAVAIGMIFGSPAATYGDGRRLIEFYNMGLDVGSGMGPVAKRRILGPRAAAIRHAFRHLMDNRRLDQIVVG
jgi:hypothetical protein